MKSVLTDGSTLDDVAVGWLMLDKGRLVECKAVATQGYRGDLRQLGVKWSGEIQTLPARVKKFLLKN